MLGGVKELDKNSPHNWLDDNIWLKKAYHEWRAPLIVNSNWWLALGDDENVPNDVRYLSIARPGYTDWQVRRAAWLVHRVLDFKAQLERSVLLVMSFIGIWLRLYTGTKSTLTRHGQVRPLGTRGSMQANADARSLVPPCRPPVLQYLPHTSARVRPVLTSPVFDRPERAQGLRHGCGLDVCGGSCQP